MVGAEVILVAGGGITALTAVASLVRQASGQPGFWTVLLKLIESRTQIKSIELRNQGRLDTLRNTPPGAVLMDRDTTGASTQEMILIMPTHADDGDLEVTDAVLDAFLARETPPHVEP